MRHRNLMFFTSCLLFVFALPLTPLIAEGNKIHKGHVGGYTYSGQERVEVTSKGLKTVKITIASKEIK